MFAMSDRFIPKDMLAWFKRKGIKPGFDYRDVWKQEHSNAFTVAKMLNADLLVEVKTLVESAIEQGQTFEQFRDILKPLLVKSGWWGVQTLQDPLTKETKLVQLGSVGRIKVIYSTNMRTARAAGQWERISRTKAAMPYLLYQLGPSREHRLEHKRWKDTLLPVDDAWWDSHMPPNGWGCKCWIRQVSKMEAAKLSSSGAVTTKAPTSKRKEWINKRTGEVEILPEGIEPGWNYNPGKAREAALKTDLLKKESLMRQTLSKDS
ncbi:phage head morphogenesis protein [Photobacterium damselae]|uniref:phage head morphogenesis protein n=1 Tax=Photobacterium damselae TaxID=38293 RepID=UPI0035A841E5